MELWIRSQDKLKLVSNCNLYISNEFMNEFVIEDLSNKYLRLGTYKTKERALEVLDEIQNILKPKYILDTSSIKPDGKFYIDNGKLCQNYSGNAKIEELSTFVYQMPAEWGD